MRCAIILFGNNSQLQVCADATKVTREVSVRVDVALLIVPVAALYSAPV